MKRIALILLLALCISGLVGCGSPPSQSYTPASQPPATEAPTEPQEIPVLPQIPHVEIPTAEVTVPQTEPEIPQTESPQQAPSDDLFDQIAQIRTWYQAIVYDPDLESVTFADAATVYLKDGQAVKITEYRQLNDAVDPAASTVHFYYHNDIPFFVLIEYDNFQYDEIRLYFANGELIRWIIDKNSPQDNVPNEEWQSYYDQAITALQNAYSVLG